MDVFRNGMIWSLTECLKALMEVDGALFVCQQLHYEVLCWHGAKNDVHFCLLGAFSAWSLVCA